MKKTIKDLTPEIRSKIQEYKERCVKDLYSGKEHREWKRENTVKYIEYVYELAKQPYKPLVVVAKNPLQYRYFWNLLFINNGIKRTIETVFALKNKLYKKIQCSELYSELASELYSELASQLRSELQSELQSELISELSSEIDWIAHRVFLVNEYARVYLLWYKFIKDEFELTTKKSEQLDWLYNNVNSAHISQCYLTKGIVLVLQMPSKIMRNEVGFHSTGHEAAIQFEGNYNINFINGRRISNWIFEKYYSGNLTFNDFNSLENEDERAGIITLIKENEGSEGVLKFLNATLIDEREINHENGYSEIIKFYKTKEKYSFLQDSKGNTNVEYAWTEFKCPSTGQVYLLDSCPTITNSVEAAKFHRPNFVPHDVEYIWQSAN